MGSTAAVPNVAEEGWFCSILLLTAPVPPRRSKPSSRVQPQCYLGSLSMESPEPLFVDGLPVYGISSFWWVSRGCRREPTSLGTTWEPCNFRRATSGFCLDFHKNSRMLILFLTALGSLTWSTFFVQHLEVQTRRSGKGGVFSRTHGHFYKCGVRFRGYPWSGFCYTGYYYEVYLGSPIYGNSHKAVRIGGSFEAIHRRVVCR